MYFKIAKVTISDATRAFDKLYSYLIPQHLEQVVQPGVRALAPFGVKNQKRNVLVMETMTVSETEGLDTSGVDRKGLKEILEVPDSAPLLSLSDIRLAEYMRQRYLCTWFEAFRCMLPKEWKDEEDSASAKKIKGIRLRMDPLSVQKAIRDAEIKIKPQISVLELLLNKKEIPLRKAVKEAGVSMSSIRTLIRNGYLEAVDVAEDKIPFDEELFEKTAPFCLTSDQQQVFERIYPWIEQHLFQQVLLHGITGSGKTEVYMQLIQKVMESGRQAIVLVPEIALTPQMIFRFKSRFGDQVAVFHSRLSIGERKDQWLKVKNAEVSIAVGARSAVFAPFSNLGIVVIDEEHESSYKSEIIPKYHAAEIAEFRCREQQALLVYGSATPSVERYYQTTVGDCQLLTMNARTNRLEMPDVRIADMRDELKCGNRSMFSRALSDEIQNNLIHKKQTLLFLNRRGYSSFVLCRDCGYVVACKDCSVSYTYHADREKLVCHYCGRTAANPVNCPVCHSGNIRHFGTGTQRVEEEIKKRFPDASVIRMDRDTTSRKDSHAEILSEFSEKQIDILIGTQMIAKGHDFPNVTLVGVLAADSLLNLNDFRAAERAFQLLTQVSGRSGRGDVRGKVIVQTYNPDHYSVEMAKCHDYEGFYQKEILVRKDLAYPPFLAIGMVLVTGKDEKKSYEAIQKVFHKVESCVIDGMTLLSPTRPPIGKMKEKYRWWFIMKHEQEDVIRAALRQATDFFYQEKLSVNAELSVDINPYSMF